MALDAIDHLQIVNELQLASGQGKYVHLHTVIVTAGGKLSVPDAVPRNCITAFWIMSFERLGKKTALSAPYKNMAV